MRFVVITVITGIMLGEGCENASFKKLFLKNMDYKALVNFLPLGVHLQICLV